MPHVGAIVMLKRWQWQIHLKGTNFCDAVGLRTAMRYTSPELEKNDD